MDGSKLSSAVIEAQEKLLLEYLLRLEERKFGRKAVYVNLSFLQQQNRIKHNTLLSASGFFHLVKTKKGQLFIIQNQNLFFVYKAEFHDDVEKAIVKLWSPTLETLPSQPSNDQKKKFLTYFDVKNDFAKMLNFIRNTRQSLKSGIGNSESRVDDY